MEKTLKKKDLIIFALIWALIFLLIGIFPLSSGNEIRVWSLFITITFTVIALIKPFALAGFYKIWIRIGEFIGSIVSKIIMFILYFCLFTPIAFILNLIGKDLLNKKINTNDTTYWVTREIQPQSMKNQF